MRIGEREFYSTGWHVINWMENWLVFTNGSWIGRPFKLLPWQKRLIHELFETDTQTGRRKYRMALIGMPRKSGKTELAAALALYMLAADGEPAAEIYCAASSERQADRVFEAARRMCELGPLEEHVIMSGTRIMQPTIRLKEEPYSFIQRLSSRGHSQHGLNIHCAILDELHTWGRGEAEELWAAISTASAAREQPLLFAITTAGWDLESRCGKLYKLGREIEAGIRPEAGFFFRWWQAPAHLDYRDPQAWRIASPSFGAIVDEKFYESQLHIPEPQFRRLYLNQWTAAIDTWVSADDWDDCLVENAELIPGEPVYIGWDASTEHDSTAIVCAQWQGEHERRLVVSAKVWQRPLGPDGNPLQSWRVPQDEVLAYIDELVTTYDVRGIAYDPAFLAWTTTELETRGLPMLKYPQTNTRMAPAVQAAYELITSRILAHNGDPMLRAHIMSSAAKQLPFGGSRLVKGHEAAKIDAAIAMIMAVGIMRADATADITVEEPSIWAFDLDEVAI